MWLGKMPLAVQAALLIALACPSRPLRRVMKSLKSEVRRTRDRRLSPRDSVCGMVVTASDGTPSAEWMVDYHFCALTCRDEFVDDSDRFVASQPV